MKKIMSLFIVIFALTILATSCFAQQLDTTVEGVWRFVEEVDHRPDGSLRSSRPGLPLVTMGSSSSLVTAICHRRLCLRDARGDAIQ